MARLSASTVAALTLAAVTPAWAGETACWFENGAIVAPAALGDMTGDFVLDLSAPQTQLHNTKAQMSGYEASTLVLSVRVAGERVDAAPIAVADLDYRGVGFVAPIAGVIGADILDHFVVVLDFAPCRLRLEPAGTPPPDDERPLEVKLIGGVPTVQATASDGFRSLQGPFALDTASNGAVRARGAEDAPRHKPSGALAGLTLAGRLYQRSAAVSAGHLPSGVVGALGVKILSGYSLRLDARGGGLWLTPLDKAKRPKE